MKTLRSAILGASLLLVLGVVVGLGANSVRGKDHIKLLHNYTPRLPDPAPQTAAAKPEEAPEPYDLITLAEMIRVVETHGRQGLDIVLDARNDEAYERGHVPGAYHCDPYNIDLFSEIIEMARAAERVIVYCHGGNCEDSYLLCQELRLRGFFESQLHVFKAGWEAWQKHERGELTLDEDAPTDADSAADSASPFRMISLKEARAIFEDDNTASGLNVFVDARADEPYTAGHIPGAVQCDYYRIDYYFPDLIMRAGGAEKIVVYCNGGDCEDSLYVCGELLKHDIPRARILLFKGGWEAWRDADLPIETGREQAE